MGLNSLSRQTVWCDSTWQFGDSTRVWCGSQGFGAIPHDSLVWIHMSFLQFIMTAWCDSTSVWCDSTWQLCVIHINLVRFHMTVSWDSTCQTAQFGLVLHDKQHRQFGRIPLNKQHSLVWFHMTNSTVWWDCTWQTPQFGGIAHDKQHSLVGLHMTNSTDSLVGLHNGMTVTDDVSRTRTEQDWNQSRFPVSSTDHHHWSSQQPSLLLGTGSQKLG